jgi:hypothetical protein
VLYCRCQGLAVKSAARQAIAGLGINSAEVLDVFEVLASLHLQAESTQDQYEAMSRFGVLQATRLSLPHAKFHAAQPLLCRHYATQHATSNRRQVTVANDDGRVNWSDLSTREKAARTTQQSFNFMIIVVGVLATVGKLPGLCKRQH